MIQTIIGVLLGGSFLAFVQFLIQRADSRTDSYEAIVKAIAEIKKEITGLSSDLGKMDEKMDMRATVEARIRILKFSDELTDERPHSKDSFDQCMSDITQYKAYCEAHPGVYYGYDITNISADHIIVVSNISTAKIFAKINGSWVQFSKAYKKVNGSWVEQSDLTTVFNSNTNYKKGN